MFVRPGESDGNIDREILNLVTYSINNPIGYTDDFGLTPSSSYSRLVKGAPKLVRDVDYFIRSAIGRLPINAAGRIYDPRTGRFLANNANRNQKIISACSAGFAAGVADAQTGGGDSLGNLDNLYNIDQAATYRSCYTAGLLVAGILGRATG